MCMNNCHEIKCDELVVGAKSGVHHLDFLPVIHVMLNKTSSCWIWTWQILSLSLQLAFSSS